MRGVDGVEHPDGTGGLERGGLDPSVIAASGHSGASDPLGNGPASALPSLSVDWRLYEEHLADADLTDEEKREFIEAMWYIVLTFVDLGFGIEPVQQVIRAAASAPPPARPATMTDSGLGGAFETAKNDQQDKGGNPERKTP